MTTTTAANELKERIEALFAQVHRETYGFAPLRYDEKSGAHVVSFARFQNGFCVEDSVPSDVYWDDLRGMMDATVEAVKRKFPHHASQKLIWRVAPEYQFGGRDFENDTPNHHEIYCRITAIPA